MIPLVNTTSSASLPSATIMVIDDEPENLNVMDDCLSATDYAVRLFTCGEQALAAARDVPPDLVLRDVRMPGMNGYDVCRRFKKDKHLQEVPILFLSALTSSEEITQGFSCGAVDYITKPFRAEEVLARVRTHIALGKAHAQLKLQHQSLLILEQQRDTYVHMLIHDMRTPLFVLSTNLKMIESSEGRTLNGDNRKSLEDSIHCSRTLMSMLSSAIDLSRLEHASLLTKPEAVTVDSLFTAAQELALDPNESKRLSLEIDPACEKLFCDPYLTVRILANLLVNAFKFSPTATVVTLGATPSDRDHIRLWVKDAGPGIAPADQSYIFEKFWGPKSPRSCQSTRPSSGLGLAFCKLATEAQQGKIGVNSEAAQGSTFWILLPLHNNKKTS